MKAQINHEITFSNTRPLLCQDIMNQDFNLSPEYPDALDQRILWWSCIQKSKGIRLYGKT